MIPELGPDCPDHWPWCWQVLPVHSNLFTAPGAADSLAMGFCPASGPLPQILFRMFAFLMVWSRRFVNQQTN